MAIEVRVCRGGTVYNPPECKDEDVNLNWGGEISDPVLCTEEAAVERGRVEIDAEYVNRLQTNVTLHSQTFTQPGSLISITDNTNSDKGLLKTININYARTTNSILVQSLLDIEMIL